MNWSKSVLIKYKKEIIESAIASFVISLVFLLYTHSLGNSFIWQKISPVEQPSILSRYFYSAFTFSTIGAFLYYVIKLWKGLYFIFVTIFDSRDLYNLVKAITWFGLMLVSYFYLVPFTVKVLNSVASFFFNMFNLVLYLLPSLGIFLTLSVLGVYILKKLKLPTVIVSET